MYLPKITIVTASYNSALTIEQTIESVLNQSYANIEYIIVDGASTDDTMAIVKMYEPLFKGRLKWVSEKDHGIYDAWNKSLNMATGDWISFVGSDDILLLDAMQNYASVIAKRPNDCNYVSARVVLVRQNLDRIRIIGKSWGPQMKTYCCIAHVGSLHHKSLFSNKGVFDVQYKVSADYDFLLRCSDLIKPCYLPLVTAKVRVGGVSDSQIIKVACETMSIKIANKCKSTLACTIDYYVAVFKFYVRAKLLNKIALTINTSKTYLMNLND